MTGNPTSIECYIVYVYFKDDKMYNFDESFGLFFFKKMYNCCSYNGKIKLDEYTINMINNSLRFFQKYKGINQFIPASIPEYRQREDIVEVYYYHDVYSSKNGAELDSLYKEYNMNNPVRCSQ